MDYLIADLEYMAKVAKDDRLTLTAIGLFVKLRFLSVQKPLDECLFDVYESDFLVIDRDGPIDAGDIKDCEFESLLAELERAEYIVKTPIVLPGQGVSHTYNFGD